MSESTSSMSDSTSHDNGESDTRWPVIYCANEAFATSIAGGTSVSLYRVQTHTLRVRRSRVLEASVNAVSFLSGHCVSTVKSNTFNNQSSCAGLKRVQLIIQTRLDDKYSSFTTLNWCSASSVVGLMLRPHWSLLHGSTSTPPL